MNPTSRAPVQTPISRAFRWMKSFVREIDESRTSGMAAEMAFWLFLSLIPLAAIAGLVVAKIAAESADVAAMLDTLPPETRRMVTRQLGHVAAWNGGAVGAPAVLVFFWLASGGVHSTFELLELKAGVSRPWWKRRLVAIGACLGVSVGAAIIAVLAGGLRRMLAFLSGAVSVAGLEPHAGFFDSAVRLFLGSLTAIGLVAGLYFIGIPRMARKRMPVLPGALLAVALQAVLGYGYVFYLSEVGIRSAYQAGLSIIGVTMIALYLFSFALLVGAELNAMLAKRR